MDIVEEALNLFRGNVYFANFEIHGPADRLLVVLILYISRVRVSIYILKTSVLKIWSAVIRLQKVFLSMAFDCSDTCFVCHKFEEDAHTWFFWICSQSFIIPSSE